MNELSLRMIEVVARGLGELNQSVAFVGGAVAGVYADDPASEDARPTMDVDCVLQLGAMNDQYALEDALRIRHFQHDTESGIICRWIYRGITVDIMPTDERILGFSNRWYGKGMANKIKYVLPHGAGKTHYKNIPVSRSFLSHANLANHAKTHHFTRVCHPDGYIRAIAMYNFARFARFARFA